METRKFSILFKDDQIWISSEMEVGNNLIGYCKILKSIIIVNAIEAVILLPIAVYTRNVTETINAGHSQYTNIVIT